MGKKVTIEEEKKILNYWKSGKLNKSEIARIIGRDKSTVCRIINNKIKKEKDN